LKEFLPCRHLCTLIDNTKEEQQKKAEKKYRAYATLTIPLRVERWMLGEIGWIEEEVGCSRWGKGEQHRRLLRLDVPTTDSQLSVCNQRVPTAAAAAVRVHKKVFGASPNNLSAYPPIHLTTYPPTHPLT